ncbi:MAG: YhcH/YjgK/YiaL family protein [Prevotella sp.]|nr:YhcH/YjgK/YiaL family protein [Prevotella sp.]
MKKSISITILLLVFCAFSLHAQTSKEARQWAKQGIWRNGFTAAKPHKTVNLQEFYEQYQKNPTQWKAFFRWLAETDLLNIPKGKHPIEGTTLVASVEDSENQPLEKRRSESHYKHIDFQYVVKGTEGFALLDHRTSPANCKYDEKKDVIHYDYDPSKTNFFDCNASKNRFVIFFPSDWHIAKIATKKKDQSIRVIVIKVDYVE